jgi:CTP:molybdopterin cytidylyltransferase MocA
MISSIVLSAGMSTRMGQPKALLDWGGKPLVVYQVEQLREAGVDEVIVVVGYRADDVRRALKPADCRVMNNVRYFEGRAGSLRLGAKAVDRDAAAIVILNVDQPRPADRIARLLAAHDPKFAATRATFEGHTGHPIVVSGWLRDELLAASDATDGLRGVLRNHSGEMNSIEGDSVYVLDMNTRADYDEAVRSFGPR